MLISIIVPTLNSADSITQCLESVLSQNFDDYEIIVQDSESTDDTALRVKGAGDPRIKLAIEPDAGIYDGWNRALARAVGDWILFLGSDDRLFDDNVLRDAAPVLASASKSSTLVYGKVMRDTEFGQVPMGEDWPAAKPFVSRCNPIPHQGVFHSRTLFADGRTFDTRYRICADYDFLYDHLVAGDPVFMDRFVARMGDGGISTRLCSALVILRELSAIRKSKGIRLPYRARLWGVLAAWARFILSSALGERTARRIHYSLIQKSNRKVF